MTPPSPPLAAEIRRRLELALDAGRQAGRRTLDFFQQACCAVERKADDSPVTAADRTAEQLLRERIAQAFPADGIVGEEFGATPGHSDFTWILDPIDGTKSFIHGVPLYGTMIGIACQERALAGFVYFPALDVTRTWGDCYGYLLVATGRAEVMIDPILNVWDAAAVQPIIEEAGGSFTDWAGRSTIQAGEAVATNGAVLAEVLQITAPFAAQGQFPGPARQSG
jgi:fructose-1,6-bisphosphatase/inositol monophosphatase family enzyme